MELSGAALQKEEPASGAIGAKGLQAPRGTTQTPPPGGQAEAAEQSFGQGDLLVLQNTGGMGTDCAVPPGLRLHLSIRSRMTLSNFLKLCRLVSLSMRCGA